MRADVWFMSKREIEGNKKKMTRLVEATERFCTIGVTFKVGKRSGEMGGENEKVKRK